MDSHTMSSTIASQRRRMNGKENPGTTATTIASLRNCKLCMSATAPPSVISATQQGPKEAGKDEIKSLKWVIVLRRCVLDEFFEIRCSFANVGFRLF